MDVNIFYSWQSDLPNKTNRTFIETALEAAAKAVRNDVSVTAAPRVDKDSQGVPGSPNIADTIYRKIADSQIMVADVSIINSEYDGRRTPNPNVLLELGYGLHALGDSKVLMLFNAAFGEFSDLPFDLRPKRIIQYSADADNSDLRNERARLCQIFEKAIRQILITLEPPDTSGKPENPIARAKRLNEERLEVEQRGQLLRSDAGKKAADHEVDELFNNLDLLATKAVQEAPALAIQHGREKDRYVLRSKTASMNILWRIQYMNSLTGAQLRMIRFKGLISLPGDSGMYFEEPKELGRDVFEPDYHSQTGWFWKKKGSEEGLATQSFAEDIFNQFLEFQENGKDWTPDIFS